jgi:serine/threonine protein kinase
MRQLIAGYNDIHKAGFLHRDIKPANILYKNGIYKYGDFGFTIPINEIHNHKNYNVGSPVYMPPAEKFYPRFYALILGKD